MFQVCISSLHQSPISDRTSPADALTAGRQFFPANPADQRLLLLSPSITTARLIPVVRWRFRRFSLSRQRFFRPNATRSSAIPSGVSRGSGRGLFSRVTTERSLPGLHQRIPMLSAFLENTLCHAQPIYLFLISCGIKCKRKGTQ